MVLKSKLAGKARIDYFVKGLRPKLLIHSGTHGDEYKVIESVKKAVEKHHDFLPDFVFVPVVSPSAVEIRKRKNGDGVDLNRSFFDDSPIEEVRVNMEIVKEYGQFDLFISFHEEPALDTFYMYQSGDHNCTNDPEWIAFKKAVRNLGVGLLTGTDDPHDVVLGYEFIDGYRHVPLPEGGYEESGEFDYWAINRKLVKYALIPEVPLKLDQGTKDGVVDLFFQKMLLAT